MAVLSNNVIAGASIADDGAGDGAYQIERSLRFNVGDEPRLTRTFGSAGNKRASTLSFWCKPSSMTGSQGYHIFGTNVSNDTQTMITYFYGGTSPVFKVSGWNTIWKVPTQVFRDPSAWYHFVVTIDTSNATADDRIRVYINGKRVTDFSTSNNPSQHAELGWGHAAAYGIGVRPDDYTQGWFNGYLADLQFIDGLALGPAAFGQFSSDGSGVWNPKAFALPAPNDGTTWSSSLTSTGAFDDAATQAFNGLTSNGAKPDDNCTATFQPSSAISCSSEIRLHFSISGSGVAGDDVTINDIHKGPGIAAGWNTFNDIRSLEKITWKHRSGVIGFTLNAIEVDGVMLRDGQTDPTTRNNPNDGRVWSDLGTASGTPYNSGYDHTKAFDGSLATQFFAATGPNSATFTFDTSISNYTKLEMWISGPHNNLQTGFKLNGVDKTSAVIAAHGYDTAGWVDIGASAFLNGAALSSFEVYSTAGNTYVGVHGIKVDGHVLIDSTVDNSFHLKFNDTSRKSALGKDSLNGAIADATGGLPIYNTTDDYGETKGSGYRSDSSAGTTDGTGLVLAVPGDSIASGTCDVHQQINTGSSNKAVTVGDGAAVSTTESRLYGSSLYFDGSDDYLSFPNSSDFTFGSGNFTVELWIRPDGTPAANNGIIGQWDHSNDQRSWQIQTTTDDIVRGNVNTTGASGGNTLLAGTTKVLTGHWYHVAFVRNSNTLYLYINGILDASTSFSGTIFTPQDPVVIGSNTTTTFPYKGWVNDARVYKGVAKYTSNFKPPTRNDFTVNSLTSSDSEGMYGKAVSTATGAKPVLVTTDTYGSVTSGATRTHSTSNLLLALALNTTANLTDDKSSHDRSITNNGTVTATTNAQAYYNGVALFNSNSQNLTTSSSDFNFGGHSNPTNFTVEMWFYTTQNKDYSALYDTRTSATDSNGYTLSIQGNGEIYMYGDNGFRCRSGAGAIKTNQWYHVALQRNTNTFELFLDGVLLSSVSHNMHPSNNGQYIGNNGWNNGDPFKGYIQDVRVYATRKYTGNFIVTRPKSPAYEVDSLVDSPTNYGTESNPAVGGEVRGNYCTLNPLDQLGDAISKGNLYLGTHGGHRGARGTFGLTKGKWYWEYTTTTSGTSYHGVGTREAVVNHDHGSLGDFKDYWLLHSNTTAKKLMRPGAEDSNYLTSTGAPVGEIIQVMLDMDNYKVKFGNDNTWGAEVDLASTIGSSVGSYKEIFPIAKKNTWEGYVNFGQRPFKYAAPAGYKTICTQNIDNLFDSETSENNPSKYFDVKTYTGTGSTLTVGGIGFQPDLVWVKRRNAASDGVIQDAARGFASTTKISSSSNKAESTVDNGATDPKWGYISNTGSGSFEVNPSTSGDQTAGTNPYVAWLWDAGTAGAANDEGSTDIASPNQWKNATAGFSITKYTGNGASRTIGHGLGAKPDFWITKDLDEARTHAWRVWHTGLSGMNYRLELDAMDGESTSSTSWDNTAPTNTVFSLGADDNTNKSGNDYIMYCWTAIPGYSAFGKYTGNGDNAGPFVYTGFRPRWYLMKELDDSTNWLVYDSERDIDNPTMFYLFPNSSAGGSTYDAASTDLSVDFLSNGFKLRNSNSGTNASGDTYIYAAFAEHPFKTARAR